MTNSPHEGQDPTPPPRRRSPRLWRWAGWGLGAGAVVGGAAGGLWLWGFVQRDLAPLIETQVTKQLNRPVEIGELQSISLTQIVFGPSALPATESDRDRAELDEIKATFNPLQVLIQRRLDLDVTLVRPRVFLDQEDNGRWVVLDLGNDDDDDDGESIVKVALANLRLQDGEVVLAPSRQLMAEIEKPGLGSSAGARSLVTFAAINGVLSLFDDNQALTFDVETTPQSGGTVDVKGEAQLDEQRYRFTVQAQDFNATDISSVLAIPVTLDAGQLFMNTTVDIQGNALKGLQGTARVADGAASVEDVPQPITGVQSRVRFSGQEIRFDQSQLNYGSIPLTIAGVIDLGEGYDLTARAEGVTLEQVRESADFDLPIPIVGSVNLTAALTGDINQPDISGTLTTQGLLRVDKVDVDSARTDFRISVADRQLVLSDFQGNLRAGGTVRGGGVIPLGGGAPLALSFQVRDVAGDAIAQGYGDLPDQIRLGLVAADVRVAGPISRVETLLQWQALQGTYPARGEIAIAGGITAFRDTVVQVAGGVVNADGAIANGLWQAEVVASAVSLASFSPQLRGLLDSRVRLGGSLQNPSLQNIRAEGTARLSDGVSLLERPVSASFRWLGDRLSLDQLSAPGLSANGLIFADLRGTPQISRFDLGVNLQDFDLTPLRAYLPASVNNALTVVGQASFDGRVSGTPRIPIVAGNLRLANLTVNQLAFEPVLSGPINVAVGQRVAVDLQGQRDRLSAQLDGRYYPIQFLVRRGESVASGQTEGDRLRATLANFPLQPLNLSPAQTVGLGPIRGNLNGTLDLNLNTFATAGTFNIDAPGIGHITANQLSGGFRYADGSGRLTNGELRIAESRFLIEGSATFGSNPEFSGQLVANTGRVQDLLRALQWFELGDIGRGIRPPRYDQAVDIATLGVGDPNDSLLNQLRRLAEIQALQDLQAEEQAQGVQLPPLSEFEGEFTGSIVVAGSARDGVDAQFGLNGSNWRWGDYDINQVIAQGDLTDGVVSLLPLRVEINDNAFINIAGQFGGAEQTGQLQAQNIPVEPLLAILNLPLEVTGNLNANAVVEGSLDNPLARGEITLTEGSLNRNPLESAQTVFSYTDARLNFIGEAGIPEATPLRVRGSIPYQLPFMAVFPDSDEISLVATVEDDGLTLLRLFTNQVAWEGGSGQVDLQVSGTLDAPQIVGTAAFNEASISALALPEPLTNVTGQVNFNRRLVEVSNLSGQFRQGQVTARGVLPIFDSNDLSAEREITSTEPLTINLDQLVLNFKGLYRGGVNGNVVVGGSALAPLIMGDIVLSNGQVELSTGRGAAPTAAPEPFNPNAINSPPRLDNLRITLGDRLRVTLNPVLNFVARGEMTVNGVLGDLEPEGTIRLRSGQVNLFTTQFGLVGGYENVAIFEPDQGLDPFLDVRLVTSVPEVRRVPTAPSSPFAAAEISETLVTDIGAVGTVRVEARVQGRASQLSENLELASSPARSEAELIGLLGGNVVGSLAEGDGTLAIANLAGSALLTQVQNAISRALGITEFRLYPTILPSDTSSSSTLELASEIGFNITGRFSTSVLAILTAEAPVQLNLRYRLTDQLLMRGYIDTDGGSGAIVEFESRF